MTEKKICSYYVAKVNTPRCWFLSSVIRGTEHIAFDRCLDKSQDLFEFFVPQATENIFLELMAYLQKNHVIFSLEKKENRFFSVT